MKPKLIAGAGAVLVALLLAVVARPSVVSVERTVEIDASTARIVDSIRSGDSVARWLSWGKPEAKLARTFAVPPDVKVSRYDWRADDGTAVGAFVVESATSNTVKALLQTTKPSELSLDIEIHATPNNAARTMTVAWSAEVHHGFLKKLGSLLMNVDGDIESNTEKSLAALKEKAEAAEGEARAIAAQELLETQARQKDSAARAAAHSQSGPFAKLAAGEGFTCGLLAAGAIRCWGLNKVGQASPPDDIFTDVAAGKAHACAIRKGDGSITCWGGPADQEELVRAPTGKFTSLTAGELHICALEAIEEAKGSEVRCWGSNDNGRSTPPDNLLLRIRAAAEHTCGEAPDHAVLCWGRDPPINPTSDVFNDPAPRGLDPPRGVTFSQLAFGSAHACGVVEGGGVQCWGDGAGKILDGQARKIVVLDDDTVCVLSASGQVQCGDRPLFEGTYTELVGGEDPCALDDEGALTCFDPKGRAQRSSGAFVAVFVKAEVGVDFVYGLDAQGTLHETRCRPGADPPCSSEPFKGFTEPARAFALLGHDESELGARGDKPLSSHLCVLKTDASLACIPDDTQTPKGTFKALVAADFHACALDDNGKPTCWGREEAAVLKSDARHIEDSVAELAIEFEGTLERVRMLKLLNAPDETFTSLAAGKWHTCGLTDAGAVACWGTALPEQPPANEIFKLVAAGGRTTCGLAADDSVHCWGANARVLRGAAGH